MPKKVKSENQKERNRKGLQRIKRFEGKQTVETTSDNDVDIVVVYQKKEPGEWERVEIPYKRKKR